MLILSLLAPLLYTALVVWGIPLVVEFVSTEFNTSIMEYVPFFKFFLMPVAPMLFGMVYGFILLDERDGGVISYLAITPLGKSGYLAVRMIMPVLYSLIFNIFFIYISGLDFFLNTFQAILLSLIMAVEAPMMLLFLGAFAGNKVEGIAISKSFGILLIMLIPDFVFQDAWLWIFSVSPIWWLQRAVFHPVHSWGYLLGAAILHFVFILLLYRRFNRRFD
jgi:fluoroquinolone transport system permease protein